MLHADVYNTLMRINSEELSFAILLATQAGENLATTHPSGFETKEDRLFTGIHSPLVTAQDKKTQSFILTFLREKFPSSFFLAEETEKGSKRLLSSRNYIKHVAKQVWCVDPIDGTSAFAAGLAEWCVCIGEMENLEHSVSVIYAPMYRGGFLAFGKDKCYVFDNGALNEAKVKKDCGKKILLFGGDTHLSNDACVAMHVCSSIADKCFIAPSGELALALVAAGKVDGVVQSQQCVWDWFAGYHLAKLAGAKVVFYDHKRKELFDKPLPEHYTPGERCLSLIAGTPEMVTELVEKKVYEKFVLQQPMST